MKKSILSFIFALTVLLTHAQISKKFSKQFEAIEKAPLSLILGETKPKDPYSVFQEIHQSKMPLDGFDVIVGKKETFDMTLLATITENIVVCTYKEQGAENFEKIVAALKNLPYELEIETNTYNLYSKYFNIISKSSGKKVAELMLSNFNAISLEFASKD